MNYIREDWTLFLVKSLARRDNGTPISSQELMGLIGKQKQEISFPYGEVRILGDQELYCRERITIIS